MLIRAGRKSRWDTNIGAGGGGVVDMATGGRVDMTTKGWRGDNHSCRGDGDIRGTVRGRMAGQYVGHTVSRTNRLVSRSL